MGCKRGRSLVLIGSPQGAVWRRAIACVSCVCAVTVGGPGAASAGELSSSLTIVGSPFEAEQRKAEEEAWYASPEGQRERQESQTRYENLTAPEAQALAASDIPGVIQTSDGGPPELPAGQRIVGFVSPYAAQVDLGEGETNNGLVESLEAPMAVETSEGRWAAVDVSPQAAGGGFEATKGLVEARLPKHLGEGAQLTGVGITVTPVDSKGSPLAGEGVIDGASVFYANAQADADAIMKFSTFGVVSDAWLRSEASPEQLSYALTLPAGASLQTAADGSGAVDVVRQGAVIAQMSAPSASDSAGYRVPVSVAVSGNVVTLTVTRSPGAVLYPVRVDPEFNTVQESATAGAAARNWVFTQAPEGGFTSGSLSPALYMNHPSETFPSGDWGVFAMQTKGDSKIYETSGWLYREEDTVVDGWNELLKESAEATLSSAVSLSQTPQQVTVCPGGSCSPSAGAEKNAALYEAETMHSSVEETKFPKSFIVWVSQVNNYIAQPKETHAVTTYATAKEVGHTNNVLSASTWGDQWLGGNQGAFEFEATDAGLGVAAMSLEVKPVGGAWKTLSEENFLQESWREACAGVQCSAAQHETVTFASFGSAWPQGEDVVRVAAHDPMANTSSLEHQTGEAMVKVDDAPPHAIGITGGVKEEISGSALAVALGEVTAHVTIKATDGEGSVLSSGVKSIEVAIDGHSEGHANGSCEPGPCTAVGEWTINGSELGAGAHTLRVVATDYAGNVGERTFPLNVYAASPTGLGPGSVNPQSGDFALEATDVSMSGGMGGLSVSRHYDSLNTTEGANGPLGPQWTISLGSLASLEVLPDGSVMLAGPEGLAHFAKNSKGGFEAPPGDGNLTLETKAGEYLLKDAKEGTTTRFTKPEGAEEWLPTVSEGPIATNTTTDSYQVSEVEGKKIVEPKLEVAPHPNATCTYENLERGCRALTFNYAATTTATGESSTQWGDYKGNLTRVYFHAWEPAAQAMKTVEVAHYLYDKQGRLRTVWDPRISPELKLTYGYDAEGHVTAITPPGQQPVLISYGTTTGDLRTGRVLSVMRPSATTQSSASSAPALVSEGAANGQLKKPDSAAVDPKGDVWIADTGNNRVQEFSSSGEYLLKFGSGGTGNGQVKSPEGIAVDGKGNLWVADTGNNRVQEFSATGVYVKQFATTQPRAITVDASEHIWVTSAEKVTEFTLTGEQLRTFGSLGSGNGQFFGASGIAVDKEGHVWVSDEGNGRVQEFSATGEYIAQHAVEKPKGVTITSTGDLWITRAASVEEMAPSGQALTTFGSQGGGNEQFKEPRGILIDSGGNVWVADTGNNRMEVFNSELVYVRQFGGEWGNLPALTTKLPLLGSTVTVSKGLWSGAPLAYTFQWLRCNAQGSECAPVAGAVNESYRPVDEDVGHALKVEVRGLNAAGAGSGFSLPSNAVAREPQLAYMSQFGEKGSGTGQLVNPHGVAVDGNGDVWVADTGNNRVQEFSANDQFIRKFGAEGTGNGQFKIPLGVAVDGKGDVWVADEINNRVQEFSSTGSYISQFAASRPGGAYVDGSNNVWVTSSGTKVEKFSPAGELLLSFGSEGAGNGQFKDATGVAVDKEGHVWVTEDGISGRVQEFSSTGSYLTQYAVYEARGIASGSEGHLWITTGSVVQERSMSGTVLRSFGTEGTGNGQFKESTGIALDGEGHVWVADCGNARIQELVLPPVIETSIPPPNVGSSAVTTVDYGAPVSGEGAPYQLGSKEVEVWAQKDQPAYATAMFPPREPQSWPASDYKHATLLYMDSHARTVNVAVPSGGIATTEYNEQDEVTRALSAANRAKALEAGTTSAEVSRKLDTESVYEEATGQPRETKGPEHLVQLKDGETMQARNKVHYYYDEGAPEGERHGLVTKTTDGAEAAGKEYDVRETITNYSGQNNLGWKLREPTSTTTDPSGLDLVHTTIYDASTGNVVETRSPGAGPAEDQTSKLLGTFGASDPSHVPLGRPQGVAVDSKGDTYITDTEHSRVVEISPTGEYIRSFGIEGTARGQLMHPQGIALDTAGNVWVADTGNNRVLEFTSSGGYVREIAEFGKLSELFKLCLEIQSPSQCEEIVRYEAGTGRGAFKEPAGIAVDSKGYIYVVDTGNSRVQKAEASGEFLAQFGSEGTGEGNLKQPHAAAVDSKGNVWVADSGNKRIEEFSATGAYIRTPLILAKSISGVSIDTEGHVWASGNMEYPTGAVAEEFSSEGSPITGFGTEGTGNGAFREAGGIAAAPEAKLWIADTGNDRVQEMSNKGGYLQQFRPVAQPLNLYEPVGAAVDSTGNLWTADTGENRIQETSIEGTFLRAVGEEGRGNGQFKKPAGVTVDAAGHVWVADTGNNRVQELSGEGAYIFQFGSQGTATSQFKEPSAIAVSGEDVYVVDRGNARVQELTSTGAFLRQFGTEGEGKLVKPQGLTIDKAGNVWVTDSGTGLVVEFSSTGTYLTRFGAHGTGQGEFSEPVGIQATGPGNLWVADAGDGRVQQLTSTGVYLQQLGSTSQFNQPTGLALNSTTGQLAVVNRGNGTIERWHPGNANHEAPGTGGVHSTATIYYTAGTNTTHPQCGEHAEWVQLPCEALPGAQPETPGLPPLPITRIEYNAYDQPEKRIETFGTTTSRTQSTSYDAAGRPLTATLTGTYGEPMPKITDHYEEKTGALVEQTSEQGSEVLSVKRTFNSLGQATSYTDASGNKTTYSYDQYGRPSEVNYDAGKLDGMEAWQRYGYDETTGALSEIHDSAAGVFKASRDVEGRITSESYPNELTESFAYNSIGEALSQTYLKNKCSSKCTWFEDSRTSSVHGETFAQESTLAKDSYAYDNAGRLTEVKETPTGEGCQTRLYSYDVETNRMSLTARKPAAEGKCATEGGEAQSHSYDQANRLTDTGTVYDGFGDITSLPASDAGGTAIASHFYVDGQLASQTQGETSHSYKVDPEDRTMLTNAYNKEILTSATVSHYAGASGTPSWTYNETAATWTRQIGGFAGLAAVQEAGHEAVLQLSDLNGNVVETASLSASAAEPLTKERSTEFGVPVSEKPVDKYSWLGSSGLSSAFPSTGVVAKDGSTYVPQIGRPLQTTTTAPPIPTNKATPYVSTVEPWVTAGAASAAAHELSLYEEQQRKIREAEEAAAASAGAAAAAANALPTPLSASNPEWCGEEYGPCACDEEVEGCGPDPEHGTNSAYCSVWVSWGHPLAADRLTVIGHAFCVRPEIFEMKIALLEETAGGHFHNYQLAYKTEFHNAKEGEWDKFSETWHCIDKHKYQAWVWGRYWYGKGKTVWYATAEDGHTETCSAFEPAPY
jgi:YD repeat-containing protein